MLPKGSVKEGEVWKIRGRYFFVVHDLALPDQPRLVDIEGAHAVMPDSYLYAFGDGEKLANSLHEFFIRQLYVSETHR